jgi:hypothetical protein
MKKRSRELVPPKWEITEDTVTITFDRGWLMNFIESLNEWESFTRWTRRADCKNWKRSLIARENRRESIVLSNCLGTVQAYLGRREVLKLQAAVKVESVK